MSDHAHPEESREATHAWIKEWVNDNAYAHGLADDVFDLISRAEAAEAERDSVILAQSAINAQAERAEARVTELEAALAEYREKQRQCALDPYVQKRRTHDNLSFHDGYYNGRIGAVTDLDAVLAALAKEDTA